jgi:hypothetical protein
LFFVDPVAVLLWRTRLFCFFLETRLSVPNIITNERFLSQINRLTISDAWIINATIGYLMYSAPCPAKATDRRTVLVTYEDEAKCRLFEETLLP